MTQPETPVASPHLNRPQSASAPATKTVFWDGWGLSKWGTKPFPEKPTKQGGNMRTITVYSRENCMQCKATERYLTKHSIPYTAKSADDNLDYLKSAGYQTLPVVEIRNNNTQTDSWSGYRPNKLSALIIPPPAQNWENHVPAPQPALGVSY